MTIQAHIVFETEFGEEILRLPTKLKPPTDLRAAWEESREQVAYLHSITPLTNRQRIEFLCAMVSDKRILDYARREFQRLKKKQLKKQMEKRDASEI